MQNAHQQNFMAENIAASSNALDAEIGVLRHDLVHHLVNGVVLHHRGKVG